MLGKVVTAAVVASSLVLTACGESVSQSAAPQGALRDLASGLPTTAGSLVSLPALPSESPESGYEGGGGGLIGQPYPVWGLPGARSATDPGIPINVLPVGSVISLRPTFTATPGQSSYRFVVQDSAGQNTIWDSADAGSNPDCSVSSDNVSCTLPEAKVGQLVNGQTYRVVTTAGTVTTPRLFVVNDQPGASGSNGAGSMGRPYSSAASRMRVGITYTTADQGPTPGTAVSDGARWGLPAGWEWEGPPGGFITLTRSVNAAEYAGYTELLTVDTKSSKQTLGCQKPQGAVQATCGPMNQGASGQGLVGVVQDDGSVVIIDQSTGQNFTFDTNNQLVSLGGAGTAQIGFTYRNLPNSTAPVLATMAVPDTGWQWNFLYSGDAGCEDSQLSEGFVKAPAGYTCGWSEPSGDRTLIFYTQPDGATVPRISRTVQTPPTCQTWQSCDASQLSVFEMGWDSKNRPVYTRQDAVVTAAVLGNISQDDQSYWSKIQFDDLGRIQQVQQMLFKPDGAGGSGPIGGQTDTYDYQPADSQYAPATQQVSVTTSADGVPTTTSINAFDDTGRQIFVVAPDGVTRQTVWDPDKTMVYAHIQNGYSVSSASYDSQNRMISSTAGGPEAFNLATCAAVPADGSVPSEASCAPTGNAAATTVTKNYSYDMPSATGNGLRAQWYDNQQYSGNPSATTFESQDSSSGFGLSAPAGVKNDGWSVVMTGGIALPKATTWNLSVDVPQGMFSGGTLLVNGTICAVVVPDDTEAACTFTSDGSTYPVALYLANADGGRASGNVSFSVQSNVGRKITNNSSFLPFWGQIGQLTSIDHNEDGSPVTYVAQYGYDSPLTTQPTTITQLPIGPVSGSLPDSVSRTMTYESNGYGGATPMKITGPTGDSRAVTYWGMKDTPDSLPNSNQIPASLLKVPQQGLQKVHTGASGTQLWSVYDQYGNIACHAQVQQGNDPAWSCIESDGRGYITRSVTRGQDGQDEVDRTYTYYFDPSAGDAPWVTQITRTEAGNSTTSESRTWLGGHRDTYVADDGSTTSYTWTPSGQPSSTTTQVSMAGAQKAIAQAAQQAGEQLTAAAKRAGVTAPVIPALAPPTAQNQNLTIHYENEFDDQGRMKTLSDGQQTLASINYSDSDPRQILSVDLLDKKLSVVNQFDQYNRPTSATWNLPDGSFTSNLTNSVAGRISGEQFDSVENSFRYDPYGRLMQADLATSDSTHSFTYGFDIDGNRTCAAADIPNPNAAACEDLTGATKFTYENQKLVSTTSPTNAIPPNSLLKDGSFSEIGSQQYGFDASRQLNSVSVPSAIKQAVAAAAPVAKSPAPSSGAPAPSTSAPSPSASAPAPSASAPAPSTSAPAPATSAPASADAVADPQSPVQQLTMTRDTQNRIAAQATITGTSSSGYSYIYAAPDGPATATVGSDGSVKPLIALPGGLSLIGDSPVIQSPSGLVALQLNSDGTKGTNTPQVWGPYGEAISVDPISGTSVSTGWHGQNPLVDGTLMNLGVRGYRADVGTFLQPDPLPGGSGTFNDFAYVSGDPINATDLTGTAAMWAEVLGNIMSCAIEFLLAAALDHLAGKIPESFLSAAWGSIGKATAFLMASGLNLAMSVGLGAALDHGQLPSAFGWVMGGICAAGSGYIASTKVAVRDSINAIARSVENTLTGGRGFAATLGQGPTPVERFTAVIGQGEAAVGAASDALVATQAGVAEARAVVANLQEQGNNLMERAATVMNRAQEVAAQAQEGVAEARQMAATARDTFNQTTAEVRQTVSQGGAVLGAAALGMQYGGPAGALIAGGAVRLWQMRGEQISTWLYQNVLFNGVG